MYTVLIQYLKCKQMEKFCNQVSNNGVVQKRSARYLLFKPLNNNCHIHIYHVTLNIKIFICKQYVRSFQLALSSL